MDLFEGTLLGVTTLRFAAVVPHDLASCCYVVAHSENYNATEIWAIKP